MTGSTRRAFLKTTALVAAGVVAVRVLPRPAGAMVCEPSGDAFPLTLPFRVGDDCAPVATAMTTPTATPTPWHLWLPQVPSD